MSSITRTFDLKYVRFRSGRRQFVAPPIESLMLAVKNAATTVAQRHSPPPQRLIDGTPCMFIDRIRERRGASGVMFDVHSYTSGAASHRIRREFNLPEAHIESGRIVGDDGSTREIITTFRCLAFGQALIVERVRGGGSLGWLAAVLTDLFRKCVDQDLPTLALEDVKSPRLKQLITAGGGIKRVQIGIVGRRSASEGLIAKTLAEARRSIGGAGSFSAIWTADEEGHINADDAIRALKNYAEESELDSVNILLKNGNRIRNLSQYRECLKEDIQVVKGVPVITEIEAAMRKYLTSLMTVEGQQWRVLQEDGYFVNPEVLQT